jgi:hypothetical protein
MIIRQSVCCLTAVMIYALCLSKVVDDVIGGFDLEYHFFRRLNI